MKVGVSVPQQTRSALHFPVSCPSPARSVESVSWRCHGRREPVRQFRGGHPPRSTQRWRRRLGLSAAAAEPEMKGMVFRQATDDDVPAVSRAIRREAMNPLNLKPERFVVAARRSDSAILGFGQLAPLDGAPQDGPQWLELRSLIVQPEHRGEGIGRQLLSELVQRGRDANIFLTTLKRTTRFYSPEGFQTLQSRDIPRSLLFEYIAGTVFARIAAGDELVVMHRPPDGG